MARLQFDPPALAAFATEIQIYISHVNQGGHLDNAQLMTLVSEARVRFFKLLGYREGDVEGCPIVVADIGAQYKSEAFHGETLRIELQPADLNRYGFDLRFQMRERDGGREVARGKTGVVFTDRNTHRPTPMPEAFRAKLLALMG